MSNKSIQEVRYSVLDLATIAEGSSIQQAFKNSRNLAQKAEELGYTRFWLAEHHNMISVGSSATVVLLGYVAEGTSSIRVGSGGIMLPNHSPLIVAEQFGTLETLYPNRMDLGLGRAPGTDQATALAIRGANMNAVHDFPQDVIKLQQYFSEKNSSARVRAIPGEGLDIPIWILGSSTDSAHLAAALGLPYAFASHFAPAQLLRAIDIYRREFKPSVQLQKPYVMAGINVIAANSDHEAEVLSTSLKQMIVSIIRRTPRRLQAPVTTMEGLWTDMEEEAAAQMMACSFIGSSQKVTQEFQQFVDITQVDEVIVTAHIYDQAARLNSYKLFADIIRHN